MQLNRETLKPMQPTPYDGAGNTFTVICTNCYRRANSDEVLCDLAAPPFTFYCLQCVSSYFDFGNGPVPAHKHPNGGGWVANTAKVAGDVYVGLDARVFGNAEISGEAAVYNSAQVFGDARVYGNAHVFGEAKVYGKAHVYGDAQVHGNALVYGDAQVSGYDEVDGNSVVSETKHDQ